MTATATGAVDWVGIATGIAAYIEPAPDPIIEGDRLQTVREGMAAGRDMGIWAEVVRVYDAIIQLRDNDRLIIAEAQAALEMIVTAAKNALTVLRADATAGFLAVNERVDALAQSGADGLATLRADTTQAIATVRSDATTAITAEATTRGTNDTTLQTNITGLSSATTSAITADRGRLSTIEQAIATPTTGITARLTRIEQRLAAAGIP